MIKIAVTGGIGSGKSVVSNLLRVFSYPVYDADAEAKRLMTSSRVIQQNLTQLLGPSAYDKDGKLNRPFISSAIFSDKELLHKVNAIVHPVVKDDFRRWSTLQKKNVVFMESAILFESGFETEVDKIWLVTAPRDLRICRTMSRDSVSAEMVERRMAAQWPEEKKAEYSDAVIVNDGSHSLIEQVRMLLSTLAV